VEICRHRIAVYEQVRQRHPRRWSRSTRCWSQPEVVRINPPPPEIELQPATFAMAACSASETSSFLAATVPDARMRLGICFPAWYQQLVAVRDILIAPDPSLFGTARCHLSILAPN